jgi:hypothetical protein
VGKSRHDQVQHGIRLRKADLEVLALRNRGTVTGPNTELAQGCGTGYYGSLEGNAALPVFPDKYAIISSIYIKYINGYVVVKCVYLFMVCVHHIIGETKRRQIYPECCPIHE